jgi:hypothetical protein
MGEKTLAVKDRFEFYTALLLGLGAIFTALASFQSGLWGGVQAEAYSRANAEATAAASEHSRAIVEMARDAQIDITAYKLIQDGLNMEASNPAAARSWFEIATYLYTRQLSDAAYKAIGLPPEARKDRSAAGGHSADDEEIEVLKTEILDKASEADLVGDPNYQKEMFAKFAEMVERSKTTFREGQAANKISDGFELATVIIAISMFFLGIALVFKTDIRWKMLIAGGVLLAGGVIYMITLPWTF